MYKKARDHIHYVNSITCFLALPIVYRGNVTTSEIHWVLLII